eukprot:s8685_g1.t1
MTLLQERGLAWQLELLSEASLRPFKDRASAALMQKRLLSYECPYGQALPLDVTWPAVPEELTNMVEPFTILKFFAVEGPPAIAMRPLLCADALLGGLRVLALDPSSSAAVRVRTAVRYLDCRSEFRGLLVCMLQLPQLSRIMHLQIHANVLASYRI